MGRTDLLPLLLCLPIMPESIWLIHSLPLSVHRLLPALLSYPEQIQPCLLTGILTCIISPVSTLHSPAHPSLFGEVPILKIYLLKYFPRTSQGFGDAKKDQTHLRYKPWPVPGASSLQTYGLKQYHWKTLLFWHEYKFPNL